MLLLTLALLHCCTALLHNSLLCSPLCCCTVAWQPPFLHFPLCYVYHPCTIPHPCALASTLALLHCTLHSCTQLTIAMQYIGPNLSTALIALSLTPTLHWNRKTFWVTCSEHFLQCYALLCNRMHCNVKSTLCHLLGNPQR